MDRLTECLRERRRLDLVEVLSLRALLALPVLLALGLVPGLGDRWWHWVLLVPAGLALLCGLSLLLLPVPRRLLAWDRELGAGDALATLVLAGDAPGGRAGLELLRRDLGLRLGPAAEPDPAAGARLRRIASRLLALALLVLVVILLAPRLFGGNDARSLAIAPAVTHVPVETQGQPGEADRSAAGRVGPDAPEHEREREDAPRGPEASGGDASPEARQPGPEVPSPRRRTPPRTTLRPDPDRSHSEPPAMPPAADWQRQVERALARGRLAPWEGRWLEQWGRQLDLRRAAGGR
ncbi:MAG: hypothetical protein R3F30_04380 [Planctomycetota bacterium]